jgi:hypothetical protein
VTSFVVNSRDQKVENRESKKAKEHWIQGLLKEINENRKMNSTTYRLLREASERKERVTASGI